MSAAASERANPRDLPMGLVGLCVLLVAIGVIAFVAGLRTDPAKAWLAYHVNFLYFGSLAQGGLALACALVIVGARWAGPIRHVAEGLAAWVPITFVLAIVGIFGQEHVFANWIHGAPYPKQDWLTQTRVNTTDLSILAALTVLSMVFLRASFRPALHGAGGPLADARGRVVGVNTLIAGGLGVAVPTTTVSRFLDQVEARRARSRSRAA